MQDNKNYKSDAVNFNQATELELVMKRLLQPRIVNLRRNALVNAAMEKSAVPLPATYATDFAAKSNAVEASRRSAIIASWLRVATLSVVMLIAFGLSLPMRHYFKTSAADYGALHAVLFMENIEVSRGTLHARIIDRQWYENGGKQRLTLVRQLEAKLNEAGMRRMELTDAWGNIAVLPICENYRCTHAVNNSRVDETDQI